MSLKYSTFNIILPNLVPGRFSLQSYIWERLCALGWDEVVISHRNVDNYFKNNLREKAKADMQTPNSRTRRDIQL